MSLPTPKEVLRRAAEVHDRLAEAALEPVRQLAASLGLPEPPAPPRATDIVESLPDLPEPPSLEALIRDLASAVGVGAVGKHEEVRRIEAPEGRVGVGAALRIRIL